MWPFFLIPVLLVLWGSFILNFIGWLCGWWSVARHYPLGQSHFHGTWIRVLSAKVGWANYNNTIRVGVNADGMCIRVVWLFRPGHPPIFVPWADVNITPFQGWIFPYVLLSFVKAPTVSFRFDKKLGDEIARAANRAWEHPESTPSATPPTPE